MKPQCTFTGCTNTHHSRGYCRGHRKQLDRGVPLAPLAKRGPRGGGLTISRRERKLREYGLTTAAYDALVVQQAGRCAICPEQYSDSKPLHVDHCHTTGDVRGLLCLRCNTALGLFQDDTDRLTAAITYLNS